MHYYNYIPRYWWRRPAMICLPWSVYGWAVLVGVLVYGFLAVFGEGCTLFACEPALFAGVVGFAGTIATVMLFSYLRRVVKYWTFRGGFLLKCLGIALIGLMIFNQELNAWTSVAALLLIASGLVEYFGLFSKVRTLEHKDIYYLSNVITWIFPEGNWSLVLCMDRADHNLLECFLREANTVPGQKPEAIYYVGSFAESARKGGKSVFPKTPHHVVQDLVATVEALAKDRKSQGTILVVDLEGGRYFWRARSFKTA